MSSSISSVHSAQQAVTAIDRGAKEQDNLPHQEQVLIQGRLRAEQERRRVQAEAAKKGYKLDLSNKQKKKKKEKRKNRDGDPLGSHNHVNLVA